VDFLDANRAWAEKMGVTYPILSDMPRSMLRAYDALNDDPEMAKSNRISTYLRAKRAWFVIDKQGFIRYMKVESSSLVPSDELIEVVKKYN
jgi:glutaredoxin-dependent peroxiredoxin